MSEIEILREQLQQANNLINQLVASNNALAASAVAGAGVATGAAGAAVTGAATGVPMANATALPTANATAFPTANATIPSMNISAPGTTPDDCSKAKGFIEKAKCEAKNRAKAMAGQAIGKASNMAKDKAMGFAQKKWDENKGAIIEKGTSAGMSALSSAGNQFKNITGMAAKEQKKKIKDTILPFYENDGPLKQWLDKWSNNFRERVKTYIEKENFKKNIKEALNDGLSFITEEEADEFDKINLNGKRLRDDLKQDDVNFYFEKLKVDSSSEDKSWIILNLTEDIWKEFVKPDPSKMQQLSASASSMKDAATKKAEGMKSSLSDAAKKTEVDKKINSFLGDIRTNIKSAKSSYDANKTKFKQILKEREEKKQKRKQQEIEAKQELEKAKTAEKEEEKETAISKLKMQIQSFEESIKQKDTEKITIEQSKSEFQNTIQEKNELIEKINNKKCGGFFTTASGRAKCEEKKQVEINEIQTAIIEILGDISKADEEIADIEMKKSEFTKMIEDANEQIKKLEGDSSQESISTTGDTTKAQIDKKINSFLGDIRTNIKSAKNNYTDKKDKFNKILKEREEKKQLRKQQEIEAKQELEKAKMAQEKQEKEAAISKLKMQTQSFEESIKQKDTEKTTIEQSKSEFQNTIQEKNELIEKINNKKCGGFFTTASGRAKCEEKKEAEKNEIQLTIDKIKEDISKADEEIADIDKKKSEFTKMIEDANEQIKKLEGDSSQKSMQGGRKKRRRKKRTKKKSLKRKRKRKRTRKKN